MTRKVITATVALLSGLAVVVGLACDARHVDQYYGTDAGADFDAPVRPVGDDAGVADGPNLDL
jgi:hypothetical protein